MGKRLNDEKELIFAVKWNNSNQLSQPAEGKKKEVGLNRTKPLFSPYFECNLIENDYL